MGSEGKPYVMTTKVHPEGSDAAAEEDKWPPARPPASPSPPRARAHANPPRAQLCDKALGCLAPDNGLRQFFVKLTRAPAFDMVIIVFIGLNSVIMAMTDYRIECLDRNGDPGRNGIAHDNPNFGAPDPDKCWQNVVGDFTNSWVFGPVFLIEMVCKIFALGFYSEGPHTYLKNNWNILDFVCVMSWIGAQAVPSLSALQSLKMFRLLRPLKSLSKFQGLRRIVVTFMAAFDGLAVTVTLLTFLLFVVSIACMQFFKGALHFRCRITPYPTRVPDTWYRPCVDGVSCPDGSTECPTCLYGNYFPSDDEFDAYRELMLRIDYGYRTVGYDAMLANCSSVEGLCGALDAGDDYNWQSWDSKDTWACATATFPGPAGIPVTDTYAHKYAEGDLNGDDGKHPWQSSKRCLWLIDEDDGRPCAAKANEIFGLGGLHKCYENGRQQRSGYVLAGDYSGDDGVYPPVDDRGDGWPSYEVVVAGTHGPGWAPRSDANDDPVFPEKSYDPVESGPTYCGSNYDERGNRRFKFSPKVGKDIYMWQDKKKTVPVQLTDWSRFPAGLYATLYPEFSDSLNFGYTNFDNLGSAMISLFQAVTMEGWTDIMYHCMDAAWPPISIFLFLSLFAVGSMLVLNLVLGVIADTLGDEEDAEAEEEAEAAALALASGGVKLAKGEEEDDAVIIARMRATIPGPPPRLMLFDFVTSDMFNNFIYLCIGLNTVALCLDDYPRDEEWSNFMEVSNLVLAFVFIVEMVLKLMALGWANYASDTFNLFDFTIVWVSIITMILAASDAGFGGGAISAFRCFRVFRIFKLFKSWQSLQVLLATMAETAKEIGNFLVLLMLMVFIFGLLGMQLFANQLRFDDDTGAKVAFGVCNGAIEDGACVQQAGVCDSAKGECKLDPAYSDLDPVDLNFDDFMSSMITVFGVLTGESWNLVMYDLMRGRDNVYYGVFYMMLTIIILAFFVMNMFLAILLSKFEDNEELSQPAPREESLRKLKSFRQVAKAVNILKKGTEDDPGDSDAKELTPFQIAALKAKKKKDPEDVEAAVHPPKTEPKPKETAPPKEKPNVSLYMFPVDHPVRKLCVETIKKPLFDQIIIACIIVGSFMLACKTPLMDPKMPIFTLFTTLDYLFSFIFLVEFILKLIAFGFAMNGPDSYIYDPWNQLDFTIVMISIVTFLGDLGVPLGVDVKVFKVLRAFRVFRPLRMLSRYPGLRLVLNSLLVAIPAAFNVVVVCILFMSIFAILGVGFFKGQMNMCDVDTYGGGIPEQYFDTIARVIEDPIHLKKAVKSGAFEEFHNASMAMYGYGTQCWLSWDVKWVNGHDYFNTHSTVISDFQHDWETSGRPGVISSKFSHAPGDLEKAEYGISPPTKSYFTANPWLTDGSDVPQAFLDHVADVPATGNLDKYIPTSKDMCKCMFKDENAWSNPLYMSFDNFDTAFALLFEIYSTEGWLDYMYYNVDANGIEMQPIRDHGFREQRRSLPRFYSFFYHVLFQFVGGFFAMQLFVGVIIEQFGKLKEQAEQEGRKGVMMTASQEQWVKTQKFIIEMVKPKHKIKPVNVPCYNIVEGEHKATFENFIMACIVINGLFMGLDHFGQPQGMTVAIELINMMFAIIFNIEAILKILGIGWTNYWVEAWNRFDFLIVIGTDLGYFISWVTPSDIGGVASVVRLFRIARIFRLFNSAKTMKTLIMTLMSALPQMGNVGLVLMIFIGIWAILLVELFAGLSYGETVHPNANFQHVPIAILTLIRFTTGENWNGFMHDMNFKWRGASGCWGGAQFEKIRTKMYDAEPGAYWQDKWCTRLDGGDRETCQCASFHTHGLDGGQKKDMCQEFVSYENCCVPLSACGDKWWAGAIIHIFDIIVTGVVLNLFVGIILSAYEDEEEEEGLGLSETDLANFVEDWSRFDEHASWHIKLKELKELIQILDEPMGFGEKYVASNDELEAEILKLGLHIRHKEIVENDVGESRLHMFDVATALGKRLVAKAHGGDESLDTVETAPNTEFSADATPYLEKFFGKTAADIERSSPRPLHVPGSGLAEKPAEPEPAPQEAPSPVYEMPPANEPAAPAADAPELAPADSVAAESVDTAADPAPAEAYGDGEKVEEAA